ncbi:MAG TPA: gamma-glutamyl-gamma-aminobutyrate hydrolase family protein [Candidatus Acidoferrales bacterium]|nr:gamma-glutamyl-gamma-aminobutyrate hydrolase family protein [Candidatus Acidoferrales bacterium]
MCPDQNQKPRVGVPYRTQKEELTGQDGKLEKYLEAVRGAGGEPVRVSLALEPGDLKRLAQTLDAVLLPGSPADINPSRFGAARHPRCADPDPNRERTDFALLDDAFAEQKPVLAICFGIQSLNVFLGGTLIQDIPSELHTQIRHDWDREKGEPETFHAARIEAGSRLAQMARADEVVVNSSHHQSIREPGRNLRIVSRAPDGVIEAVEWIGGANWVIGVEWHPERMAARDALAQALFQGLVAAASARKTPARV